MPIIVSQVRTPINSSKDEIISEAFRKVGIHRSDVVKAEVHKISLDARKQNDIRFVGSVYISLKSSEDEKAYAKKQDCAYFEEKVFSFVKGTKSPNGRFVVVGFGPAGMMAALLLAENGYKPLVFERGASVDERVSAVEKFWREGILDTESNVQFGEGGAGTFSDGKLTTRIGDELCGYVTKKFADFGAPEEILTKAKAHIGTDNLRGVVKKIRERIIELGGEIHFGTAVTDFISENGHIKAVVTKDGETQATAVILAIGHSARDTFEKLLEKGVFIEPKAFSVGARIEHKRVRVNQSLYGKNFDNPLLPQGEYQLSHRVGNRGVYTFCMCPGGYVVPSASEEETVVTNGMSEFARDGENSNSALVVSVGPEDFGNGALDGVDFARKIEKQAFILGGKSYKAPAVTAGNFLDGKIGIDGGLTPSYSIGTVPVDFDRLFPEFVTKMMRDGLRRFGAKMSCFHDKEAVLTGAETRTSSPVRITRNDERTSLSFGNLYPVGEGAGYAGGIMSAAVDGIKTAVKIMEIYKSE